MKRIILICCAIINIKMTVFAQTISPKEIDGNGHIFTYSYSKAIDCYNNAKNLSTNGLRNLATSYTKVNNYKKAEEIFALLCNSNFDIYPEDYFQYAMLLKTNGKWDESDHWMYLFKNTVPNDLRAQSFDKTMDQLHTQAKDSSRFQIIPMEISSISEDFGTSYYQDKIVFSSTRSNDFILNRKDNRTNQPYLDLMVSTIEKRQLISPINFDSEINGTFNDGPASFNREGTEMAYTRNKHRDHSKDKIVELQIYFSSFNNEKWSKPDPFIYNNTEYSVGQPYLTLDGKTMYFTSDMPGGFGGSDLYITTKNEQNQWTKPQNLGSKINTEGDEMFPFFQDLNEVLFFASTGHYGFGGLDVFMCRWSNGKVGPVSNIGIPLNSTKDDYALILNDSLSNGYFSSNRNTDNLDHVFAVDVIEKLNLGHKIKGVTKDIVGNLIPFASITLLTEGNLKIDTLTSNKLGEYVFFVPSNKSFQLIGKKQNYKDAHRNTNTLGKGLVVNLDLVLLDTIKVDSVLLFVGADLSNIVIKQSVYKGNLKKDIAYFDFDKSNIRPDAAIEFDKICAILNDYPLMMVELSSHTDCSATKEYNQILSEKRAKASLEYIQQKITNPERITAVAYGETKLKNGCDCHTVSYSKCSDVQNQLNRRTEFIILKDKYKVK